MKANHVKTKQISVRISESTLNKINEKCNEINDLIKKLGIDGKMGTASYIRAVLTNRLEKEELEDFSSIVEVELDIETMSDSLLKELHEYACNMYEAERKKDIDGYNSRAFNYLSLSSDVFQMLKLKGVK